MSFYVDIAPKLFEVCQKLKLARITTMRPCTEEGAVKLEDELKAKVVELRGFDNLATDSAEL